MNWDQFIQAACTNAAWSQQNPIATPFFPDKKGFYWTLTSQVFYQLAQAAGQKLDRNTTTAPWDPTRSTRSPRRRFRCSPAPICARAFAKT